MPLMNIFEPLLLLLLRIAIPAGSEIAASMRFIVRDDVQIAGIVERHEGGFPIGWLIISEGGWFAEPPIVQLR